MSFPFTQIRIARPTSQLDKVIAFYKDGIGLPQIGSFHDHEGYSGVMLGMPDEHYHLEFTQHIHSTPCPPPTADNLLVFYLPDASQRDTIVQRLAAMGYSSVPPENPYWNTHGIVIADPDGWHVVLMDVPGFKEAL